MPCNLSLRRVFASTTRSSCFTRTVRCWNPTAPNTRHTNQVSPAMMFSGKRCEPPLPTSAPFHPYPFSQARRSNIFIAPSQIQRSSWRSKAGRTSSSPRHKRPLRPKFQAMEAGKGPRTHLRQHRGSEAFLSPSRINGGRGEPRWIIPFSISLLSAVSAPDQRFFGRGARIGAYIPFLFSDTWLYAGWTGGHYSRGRGCRGWSGRETVGCRGWDRQSLEARTIRRRPLSEKRRADTVVCTAGSSQLSPA